MLRSVSWLVAGALLSVATLFAYSGGLDGPFLFDDHVHITQNRWVKIDSLAPADLARAWGSSLSPFPNDRPLAQLTFGINHAISGLDAWSFKATNLVLHLLTGACVFIFVRLAHQAITGPAGNAADGRLVAFLVTALWLLHPLNVSTVLYTVQRMAQMSTLALLIASSCYLWGRIRIAEGRPGILWILAAAPVAMAGFLAKENTVLLPLLLLVIEFTLLQRVSKGSRSAMIHLVWVMFIALPIIAGLAYFATHPWILNYDARPFTLEERLLTQARVLWLYIQWLLIPDISAYGLFHDDIPKSLGLTSPPSTLAAIAAWSIAIVAAVALRRRQPVLAFAVLFYLAGHAVESTVLPLEMIFEHRNYLPGIGPMFLLGCLAATAWQSPRLGRIARPAVLGLLVIFASLTFLRTNHWSSLESFMLNSAENHPRSPRANFLAAQMMIANLDKAGDSRPVLVDAARTFLHQGISADARCIDCLFGLIVLDLHLDNRPDPSVLTQLADALRSGHVGATNTSISQFSYLVKWQQSDGVKIDRERLEAIFDAALANPGWNHTGRAGIEAAYREYHEFVTRDLEAALRHARGAVDSWPDQWSYHMQLVRVLRKLGRDDQALAALERAAVLAENQSQLQEMTDVREQIGQTRVN